MRYVFLVGSMTLVVLSACSQAAATPAPASQLTSGDGLAAEFRLLLPEGSEYPWRPCL